VKDRGLVPKTEIKTIVQSLVQKPTKAAGGMIDAIRVTPTDCTMEALINRLLTESTGWIFVDSIIL